MMSTTDAIKRLSVSFIPSASIKPLTYVALADPLERATTLMKLNDFSQLPVVRGRSGTRPIGVISWQTIGQALFLDSAATLEDCVEDAPRVGIESDLLGAIPLINVHGYVLVIDGNKDLSGIVTSADLGQALADIAKPFLLIEQCESEMRGIVNLLLEKELFDLDAMVATLPAASREPFDSPDKLTFGNLVSIVTSEAAWGRYSLRYDRSEIVRSLQGITSMRNTLMHFRRRDSAFDTAYAELPKMAEMLSAIAHSILR